MLTEAYISLVADAAMARTILQSRLLAAGQYVERLQESRDLTSLEREHLQLLADCLLNLADFDRVFGEVCQDVCAQVHTHDEAAVEDGQSPLALSREQRSAVNA